MSKWSKRAKARKKRTSDWQKAHEKRRNASFVERALHALHKLAHALELPNDT